MSDNPLLHAWVIPPYAAIRAEHVAPAITAVIEANLASLGRFLPSQLDDPTWQGLVKPYEDMRQRLLNVTAPLSRLASDPQHADILQAFAACQSRLEAYQAAIAHNASLNGALLRLSQGESAAALDREQQQALDSLLRRQRLDATHLAAPQRHRCLAIERELKGLYGVFQRNAVAVERAWALPPDAEGNPHPNDNSPIIRRILALRAERARLLGYRSYAELALATRMFDSPEDVLHFLRELLEQVKPIVASDRQALSQLSREDAVFDVQDWDPEYFGHEPPDSLYQRDATLLSAYFPALKVLGNLSLLVERLFGVALHEQHVVTGLHPSVRLYAVVEQARTVGYLYIDVFSYPGKLPGDWMDGLRDRHRYADGALQLPVGYLNCDFALELEGPQSLLTLDNLSTLLHEFGHAMHHVLTAAEHGSGAGVNVAELDAVEFPSALFERWATAGESLTLLSCHYRTGARLPAALLARYQRYSLRLEASTLLEDLRAALIDYELHHPQTAEDFKEVEARILTQTAVTHIRQAPISYTLLHSFARGDYAAGYYVYVWSQILASEAFACFAGKSVLDPTVAAQLRATILAPGAALTAMEQIRSLKGTGPTLDVYVRWLKREHP